MKMRWEKEIKKGEMRGKWAKEWKSGRKRGKLREIKKNIGRGNS